MGAFLVQLYDECTGTLSMRAAKDILALIGAGSVLCTIALLSFAAISGFRKD